MRISNLEHQIHTGNSTAVKQAICRLSPHQRQEVQKLLHTMLNEGTSKGHQEVNNKKAGNK